MPKLFAVGPEPVPAWAPSAELSALIARHAALRAQQQNAGGLDPAVAGALREARAAVHRAEVAHLAGQGDPAELTAALAELERCEGARVGLDRPSPRALGDALNLIEGGIRDLARRERAAFAERVRPHYAALVTQLAELLEAASAVNEQMVAWDGVLDDLHGIPGAPAWFSGAGLGPWPRSWQALRRRGAATGQPTMLDGWLHDAAEAGFAGGTLLPGEARRFAPSVTRAA